MAKPREFSWQNDEVSREEEFSTNLLDSDWDSTLPLCRNPWTFGNLTEVHHRPRLVHPPSSQAFLTALVGQLPTGWNCLTDAR